MSVLVLSGCASVGNFTSIYRRPNLGDGRSVVLDAEQWAVLNIPQPNDGSLTTPNQVITCAMPSPDAIAAAAAAGQLSLDNPGGTSGNAGFSASEAAASIGLRTQSIQLLRDAMYRLCETYAAGGMDPLEYGVAMRRFQSNMVAILAIEQLTGAVVAQQAAVSAGVDNTAVQLALENVRRAEDEEKKAQDALSGANDSNRAALQNAYNSRQVDVQNAHARLAAAVMGSAHAGAALAPGQGRPSGAQAMSSIAQTVEAITLAAMNNDYNSQMCFEMGRFDRLDASAIRTDAAALRQRLMATGASSEQANELAQESIRNALAFQTYCANLLHRDVANRWGTSDAINRAIDRLIPAQGPIPSANLAALQALLAQLDQGWSSGDLRDFTPPPRESEANSDAAQAADAANSGSAQPGVTR